MKYLDDCDLSLLNSKELLSYYDQLRHRKSELIEEIDKWASTLRAARLKLREAIIYLEDEIALAELERLDFDDDCLAFNDTLRTIN